MRHDPILYARAVDEPERPRFDAYDVVGMVAAVLLLVVSWGLYRGWFG